MQQGRKSSGGQGLTDSAAEEQATTRGRKMVRKGFQRGQNCSKGLLSLFTRYGVHRDLLLAAGIPCESRNKKASTALHLAALHGHNSIASLLLERGADVNSMNEDGFTPLHVACTKRQQKLAQMILSHGAEPEATSNSGLRPLRIAARHGNAVMISALLDAGAKMDEDTVQVAFWAAVAAVENTPD